MDRVGICIGLRARQRRTLARLKCEKSGTCPVFSHILTLFLRLRAEKLCEAVFTGISRTGAVEEGTFRKPVPAGDRWSPLLHQRPIPTVGAVIDRPREPIFQTNLRPPHRRGGRGTFRKPVAAGDRWSPLLYQRPIPTVGAVIDRPREPIFQTNLRPPHRRGGRGTFRKPVPAGDRWSPLRIISMYF